MRSDLQLLKGAATASDYLAAAQKFEALAFERESRGNPIIVLLWRKLWQ